MENPSGKSSGSTLQLALATGAFAICFAVFGSVSAMMPILKRDMGLNPMQVSIALALPVLLGSLGRIPLGILTDRYGGRVVFSLVMAASIIPAVLMGFVSAYWQLLLCGFFIGISLASFSVGVGFVSGWFPPERQGMALGVYGAGNIGQSLAAYGSPVLAGALGFAWGFWTFAVFLAVWLVVFWIDARNAPRKAPPKTLADVVRPLKDRMSWVLSLYYFLTFGGFVAMSVYLPTFLTDMFNLTPKDAGMRTAGFVVLATLMRPAGGMLADKIGGRAILLWVFPAVAAMAIFMACPMMSTFTMGALGMAAAIGLGNGAVFKLVPEHFPQSVGAVTGLVGAAGGLGGFFPPLVVGGVKQATGAFTWGFVLLSVFAVICLLVILRSGGARTGRVMQPV
jgi:NNP family nitrate/nitrite transporter-like MFS transporter